MSYSKNDEETIKLMVKLSRRWEYNNDFSDSVMNPNDYCPSCGKKSLWNGICENSCCDYGKRDSGFGG